MEEGAGGAPGAPGVDVQKSIAEPSIAEGEHPPAENEGVLAATTHQTELQRTVALGMVSNGEQLARLVNGSEDTQLQVFLSSECLNSINEQDGHLLDGEPHQCILETQIICYDGNKGYTYLAMLARVGLDSPTRSLE